MWACGHVCTYSLREAVLCLEVRECCGLEGERLGRSVAITSVSFPVLSAQITSTIRIKYFKLFSQLCNLSACRGGAIANCDYQLLLGLRTKILCLSVAASLTNLHMVAIFVGSFVNPYPCAHDAWASFSINGQILFVFIFL